MDLADYNKDFLKNTYFSISEIANKQERGRKLEDLVTNLFLFSGMLAKKDQRSTIQEQIDIVVQWGNFLALVEVKWLDRPIKASILQSFQWRLYQRGNMTIGIFVSMSGYSKGALEEARAQDRSLLLLDKSDVEALLEGFISLNTLLWKKLWELQKRQILFWKDFETKNVPIENVLDLHPDSKKIFLSNQRLLTSKRHNQNLEKRVSNVIVYSKHILLTDEYIKIVFSPWEGKLRGYNIKNNAINRFCEIINNLLGFSADGSFGISNISINWMGVGINIYLEQLRMFEKRYDNIDKSLCHNREYAVYYDPVYLSSCLVIELYLGGLFYEHNNNQFYIQNYSPYLLIPKEHELSEITDRINVIANYGNFDLIKSAVKIERLTLDLEKFQLSVDVVDWIYQKGYIIGAIIKNPCHASDNFQNYMLQHLPLYVWEDEWIVFLKDFVKEPDKEFFLSYIEYNPIELYGGTLYLTNIVLEW